MSDLPAPFWESRSWHLPQDGSCPAAWDPQFCPRCRAVGKGMQGSGLSRGQEGILSRTRPGAMHLQLPPRGCGQGSRRRGEGFCKAQGWAQAWGSWRKAGSPGRAQPSGWGGGTIWGRGCQLISLHVHGPSSWWRGRCGGREVPRCPEKARLGGAGGLGLRTGTFHSGSQSSVWTGAGWGAPPSCRLLQRKDPTEAPADSGPEPGCGSSGEGWLWVATSLLSLRDNAVPTAQRCED